MDPAGVNDALTLVQTVIKLGKRASNVQYEEALIAAREAIIEQKRINLDLRESNMDLGEKLKLLQGSLDKKASLHPEPDHVWLVLDGDEDASRRYCQVCYYDKDKLIPLNAPNKSREYYEGQRYCPVCKAYRA